MNAAKFILAAVIAMVVVVFLLLLLQGTPMLAATPTPLPDSIRIDGIPHYV